ncbi:MAG: hypothetical protein WD314_06490 [Trueperaceae bacterium]
MRRPSPETNHQSRLASGGGRGLWGYLLLGVAFVFCPCHLPFTIPLVAVWLGGSALSAFPGANFVLVTVLSAVVFLVSLAFGWSILSRRNTCTTSRDK